MKTLVVAVMAVMTAFTTISAQELGWSFGPKIGSNGSMFIGSDNSHARSGFSIGGFAENRVSNRFAVSGELLYSQQGDKAETNGGDVTAKFDYINVPILANWYV
ncbi:MAG: outer membrane beta-barrel protein, partial [Phocaeicola sp.]